MERLLRPAPLVALGAVLALLALLGYGLASKGSTDHPIDASAVASTSWKRLDGPGSISVASLRGKVAVLNFWASWCTPCRTEAPLIERWHEKLGASRAAIVGVDVLDVTPDAESFARQFKLTYPLVRDGAGSTLSRFSVTGYPETIVLDRSGHVAAHAKGPVDDRFFERAVVPLLGRAT